MTDTLEFRIRSSPTVRMGFVEEAEIIDSALKNALEKLQWREEMERSQLHQDPKNGYILRCATENATIQIEMNYTSAYYHGKIEEENETQRQRLFHMLQQAMQAETPLVKFIFTPQYRA
mgnify:CR=1 FL=1